MVESRSARRLRGLPALLSSCLALIGPTFAGPAGPVPQEQIPTFRAATTRVRVDVVATDDEGRFVDDLRPGELTVLEDGRPQEILGLQLVDVRRGAIDRAGPPEVADAEATIGPDHRALAEDNPGWPADRHPPSELGAVVYLVDGLGLTARNQIRLSMRWNGALRDRPGLAVPHALYRIDKIGQVREIVPLTDDIAVLRRGVAALETLADTDLFKGFRIKDPSLQRFGLLKRLCEALAGRSGRTALVYVSTGISLIKGGWPDTRVLKLQEQMHEAANAANVTLYGIDPSLMYELTGTGVDMSNPDGGSRNTRAGSTRDELGNSLRNAAAATGGRAFVGWADLDRVIEHIEQDTNRYYLLTYAPGRSGNDGGYHEIAVEVTRPGVSVRARRGYVDDPPEVQRQKRISGALSLPGATGSIPVELRASARRVPFGNPSYVVRMAVDAADLRATQPDDGAGVVRVSFHLGIVDQFGTTVFYERETLTRDVGPAPAGNESADADGRPAESIEHTETVELRPGDYELKVVVVDELGDRIGARSIALSVPARGDGHPG